MKLGYYGFETAIEFGEENFYSLVIEDANYFYEIVSAINRQAEDGVGEFVLSQYNKEMKFESAVVVISSVLDLGLNTKKVQGLVLKKLAALAQDDEYFKAFSDVAESNKKYVEKLAKNIDLPLRVERVEPDDVLKATRIVLEESNNLCEQLQNYIECLLELTKVKLLILVNFKHLISGAQGEFEKFVAYAGLKVLFIDNFETVGLARTTRIIDADKCEIIKGDGAS